MIEIVEKRTIDWFNDFPEEIRIKALENTELEFLNIKNHKSLSDVLEKAFIWGVTDEGHEYWQKIWEELKSENK